MTRHGALRDTVARALRQAGVDDVGQKLVLRRWMGGARFIYNEAVKYVRGGGSVFLEARPR